MGKGESWTKEEEAYLRKHYGEVIDLQIITDHLGRTKSSVKSRAKVLGLKRNVYALIWPPEKLEILKALYPDHSCEEIGKLIGKKASAVQSKGYALGLRKDPEWLRQRSLKSAFKKGHVPSNKGKKWDEIMSKEKQESSRSTCFKKGQQTWNHKPVGYERKTRVGYWEVKVAEPRTFKAKHRILWEQHHGPIPKGTNIVFIDGNPDNITIENLRAETMVEKFNRRCSIHTTLPPEVRQLVQLKGALMRQINKASGDKPKRTRKRREQLKAEE